MNQFFTSVSRVFAALLFIALTTESSAQSFTLPWNPDSNGDNLIGVVDLQSFLSVYNTDFEQSQFNADSSLLLVLAPERLTYYQCVNYCAQLPSHFSIPSIVEAHAFDELPYLDWSIWWVETPESILEESVIANGTPSYFQLSGSPPNYSQDNIAPHQLSTTTNVSGGIDSQGLNCPCIAKARPKIEYDFCYLEALPGNDQNFRDCVEGKAQEGWYPLGGVAQDYGRMYQAFWRWAE